MNPLVFLVIGLAGWMNRHQQEVSEYLQEEVRVLKELLGQEPRFHEDQRRHLAIKAKRLGRKGAGSVRQPGDAQYLVGLASPTGRSEVRFAPHSQTRTAPEGRRS